MRGLDDVFSRVEQHEAPSAVSVLGRAGTHAQLACMAETDASQAQRSVERTQLTEQSSLLVTQALRKGTNGSEGRYTRQRVRYPSNRHALERTWQRIQCSAKEAAS